MRASKIEQSHSSAGSVQAVLILLSPIGLMLMFSAISHQAYCAPNNGPLLSQTMEATSATISVTSVNSSDIDVSLARLHRKQSQLSKRHSYIEKDFAPKLIHQPQNVLVQANKPHAIECAIESKPEAEVKWFKDDQLLASQPPHLEHTGSELMFFQMNDDDTGDYHCQATNYLGSVTSERFKLTVQSSVHDARIRFEPKVAEVGADQQVEFTCSIPSREQQKLQRSKQQPEVSWKRNGRKLLVKWLDEGEELADTRSRFVARQSSSFGQFVLTITRTQLKDDNATFTCLYRLLDDDGSGNVNDSQQEGETTTLAHESSSVKLRVYDQQQQLTESSNSNPASHIKLDVNLAPQIANLDSAKNPHELHERHNHTTQLNEPRRINTLRETLEDLYEIAKPALIILGVLFLVSIIVILQLVYIRRRTRQNRYMKHQYLGSGGSGTSSAMSGCNVGVDGVDCNNPAVLSSLMARTLTAPSAVSLNGAGKKYRSYRDHMRKVVAANDMVNNDIIDGYFANSQQTSGSEHEPFFSGSAFPNLYNQSLAAREQARTLLQASEHMKSLSNLSHASKQQQSLQQGLRAIQQMNSSHLNLPMNFAFGNAVAATQRVDPNQSTNRLIDGPTQLMASAFWPQHLAQLAARGQQQSQSQQRQSVNQPTLGQSCQQTDYEHYKLANCSSVSPSSSIAGSNHSSIREHSRKQSSGQASGSDFNAEHQLIRDSTSLNHYSTIETNDEEDRYEELDHSPSSVEKSSSHLRPIQQDNFQVSRMSTFVMDSSQAQTQSQHNQDRVGNQKSSLRSSLISSSNSSSSGCGDSNSLVSDGFNRFGSKRTSRQTKPIQLDKRQNFQDQLSPYAVSSICGSILQQQPPPVSSEAMQALNEQFDINQLMLIDEPAIKQTLVFNTPPPPVDCSSTNDDEDAGRSQSSMREHKKDQQ